MTLLNPEYFWLFLLLAPLFLKKDFKKLSPVSYGYILTFALIVFALSRPVIEQEPIQSEELLSDVVIAIDLSYSMQATDIKPTRLGKAKEILTDLVKREQKSRFGVLGFTTNALVLSPLTQDGELLIHLFNALDEKLIVTKGSSIMPALKLAKKMSKSKKPSMLILSDGADEPSYEQEAKFAKEQGLIVNVFMLGTKIGGTLSLENGELLKDENGDIVVSRGNDAIALIPKQSGGVYTDDFDTLLHALESQKNKDFKSHTTVVKNRELFYYLVFLAILTFLASVTTLKKYLLSFLLLFGINLDASVLDYWYESIAKSAYAQGKYEKSIEQYKKIDKNRAYYNLACGYYKNGDYEKALVNFERVKSSDEKFKSEVFYNIANCFVRLKEFKKAREAYLKSLTLFFSNEADENLRYIKDVNEQQSMKTGQQKSDKKSSFAKQENSAQKKEEGGSSNMQVSANASSGAGEAGKKTKSEAMLNLNEGKAKLSSKQYELINKRLVNEKKPW
ncbi:VWA domain-containing protein [bacterium]|nr:VWA domain-containing protein [bacterium]MBU1994831.1 VWA domain-containing protein [bacterium]